MPVKIRLQRRGRKKSPFYHIVVADQRSPRDGRFIEKLGTYNPMTTPASIDLDRDRALDWLMKGAQPTYTARAILRFKGVLYKKHLMRGVEKGALSAEEADRKFEEWVNAKEQKITARVEAEDAKKREKLSAVSGKAPPRPEPEPEATAEVPAVEKPAKEDPAAEKPAKEEPAAEKPAKEEPAAEKPAKEEPAAEKPAKEEPAAEKPAKEEPAAEKPAKEEPAAEKPAKEEPAAEKPAKEEPAAEKPAKEEPAAEKPTKKEPAAKKPAKEKPAAKKEKISKAESKPDDLKKIEGIGPKISEVLQQAGIKTYADLAAKSPEDIRSILDEAEGNFAAHDPSTWPDQSKLAADGKWDDLSELQDKLKGGRE